MKILNQFSNYQSYQKALENEAERLKEIVKNKKEKQERLVMELLLKRQAEEQARLEKEKLERQKLEAEEAERKRLEAERLEKERIEREKLSISEEKEKALQNIIDWAKRNNIPEERLPRNIIDLSKIKELNLSNLKLRDFPNDLGKLEQLTHLHLGKNFVIHYPESLKNLKNLYFLDISKGNLEKVPNFISSLEHLQYLNLSENKIFNIDFSYFKKIKFLNLAQNQIIDFRLKEEDIPILEDLNLSLNPIKNLNFSKKHQESMKKLNLSGCGLGNNYFSKICELKRLENLNIMGNEFSNISEIEKLPFLTTLYFYSLIENDLINLNPISKLSYLENLYIDGKKYKSYENYLANKKRLHTIKKNINGLKRSLPIILEISLLLFEAIIKTIIKVIKQSFETLFEVFSRLMSIIQKNKFRVQWTQIIIFLGIFGLLDFFDIFNSFYYFIEKPTNFIRDNFYIFVINLILILFVPLSLFFITIIFTEYYMSIYHRMLLLYIVIFIFTLCGKTPNLFKWLWNSIF